MASYFLSPPNLSKRLSLHCTWSIVNALLRFSARISSLSIDFFILAPQIPVGTIVSAGFPASNAGSIAADNVGFLIYYWWHATRRLHYSGTWSHRYSIKPLESWQIPRSVPVEPGQIYIILDVFTSSNRLLLLADKVSQFVLAPSKSPWSPVIWAFLGIWFRLAHD